MAEKIEFTARLIAEELLRDIAQGRSDALILAMIVALIADGYGITPLAHIPLIGAMPQWFATLVITAMLWHIGGLIKWKVRGVIWFAALFESVPFIALLPLNTVALIIAISIIKARAREAEDELTQMKNELPRKVLQDRDFQDLMRAHQYH